jgi:hypothetical protein
MITARFLLLNVGGVGSGGFSEANKSIKTEMENYIVM